ncbi:FxLD family lanthipeptide [Streptoalloteichus hindustanus]|uniref:FxLD family lantipeptide n=1 Tax=Streptoalloteichus hindustanus TaxID=2017 RepID=A0A1M5MU20_STRHI|nr:FxLD family lanthipeptide [Streptoalloteichus hindustanus]SHG80642.1 FxLD family lantipeptide [Streptoalloteichus hindustanus]
MSTPTTERSSESQRISDADDGVDPFDLDITFIENTPATETVLMCSTGDNCGSSCPSACTTS